MRRYGILLAGIAVALLLGGIYVMAQRQTNTASDLVVQQRFPNHTSWVYTADFDSKEELVASGGEDGLRVWRLDNASEVYHRPGRVFLARFVKGDLLVCADANEGVLLLDTQTWQVRKKLGQKGARIVAAVSEDGNRIAASFSVARQVDKVPPKSTEIHVWQLVKGEWHESVLRGHEDAVFALAWHPTLPHLISHGEDATLRAWNVETQRQIGISGNSLVLGPVNHVPNGQSACVFNSAGTRLVTGNYLCDYEAEKESPLRKSKEQIRGVRSASFSSNGRWMATGHPDGTLHLWDSKTLVERTVVKGSINGSALNEVRFSRNGKFIVTAGEGSLGIMFEAMKRGVKGDDTVVRVWRVNITE
ncbi:MAG: WD40 repeat domain-containing protein [Pirellulaceae bacterium]|nr:WD40 repeat domain-containing protein [Pirellulaceae bacterium]